MLDHVRQQRQDPHYDPNTVHCFYGADADLIMLSLLTHEPHFLIIREEHEYKKAKAGGVERLQINRTNNMQLMYVSLLREYMELEYKKVPSKMPFDLERIIDDFVFFCFFMGNDFLPHCPSLDIAQGSLDQCISFYKECLADMDDYITEAGVIHWDRALPFIKKLGQNEQAVFAGQKVKLQEWQ